MNSLISLISQQDTFIFKHISFNALQMLAVYILIIACFKLIRKWSYNSLAIFLIAFLCVQSVWLYEKLSKTDREFIVFHTSRSTLIGKNNISNLLIASDLEIEELNKSSAIRNYTIGHDVDSLTYQNIEPVYQINESFLMIIDSNGVYNTKSIKPEYVLLRQSPKINLNRLIDSLKPEHIIADGSNFKTYIDYWERTCIKRKIPFHQTGEKGAFIIKQDN